MGECNLYWHKVINKTPDNRLEGKQKKVKLKLI